VGTTYEHAIALANDWNPTTISKTMIEDANGSLGISVVERIYGGILVVEPPKYPHIFP